MKVHRQRRCAFVFLLTVPVIFATGHHKGHTPLQPSTGAIQTAETS